MNANFKAMIAMRRIKRIFSYNRKIMLTLSILYPEVALRRNRPAQAAINRHIRGEVADFYRYAVSDLYRQAVAAYQESLQSGYPFHPYDAVLHYEITYNQNCHLSMYRDQYQFTGGAHGGTIRSSDTWNLETGRRLPLPSLFPPGQDYKAFLVEQILLQADREMQQNPGIYFEDYRSLIVKNFNEESYYLTPSGLAVYYQQYEIAPYATGIVVFTIPYETLKWRPSCPAPSPSPYPGRRS